MRLVSASDGVRKPSLADGSADSMQIMFAIPAGASPARHPSYNVWPAVLLRARACRPAASGLRRSAYTHPAFCVRQAASNPPEMNSGRL
jgi:hypothetical protein